MVNPGCWSSYPTDVDMVGPVLIDRVHVGVNSVKGLKYIVQEIH